MEQPVNSPVQPSTISQQKELPPRNWWKTGFFLMLFIIVVIIGLLRSGFFVANTNQVAPTLTPTTQIQATQTILVDETSNWKTYTNNQYGYSIKYPQDFVPTLINNDVQFTKSLNNSNGRPLLLITVMKDGNPKKLKPEEWYMDDQQFQFRSSLGSNVKITPLESNGVFGIRLDQVDSLAGYNDFKVLFFKDSIVALLNFGPTKDQLSLTNQILSTFKFLSKECTSCPQFIPPSPDFCKDGKIIVGETDECSCQLPPTCQKNIE